MTKKEALDSLLKHCTNCNMPKHKGACPGNLFDSDFVAYSASEVTKIIDLLNGEFDSILKWP